MHSAREELWKKKKNGNQRALLTLAGAALGVTMSVTACASADDGPAAEADGGEDAVWNADALTPLLTACTFDKTSGAFAVKVKDGEVAMLALSSKNLTVNGVDCTPTATAIGKVKSIAVTVVDGEPTTTGVRVFVDQTGGPLVKGTATAAATKVTLRGIAKDQLWVRTTSKADTVSWQQGSGAGTGTVSTSALKVAAEQRVKDIEVAGAGGVLLFGGGGNDIIDASTATVGLQLFGAAGDDTLNGGSGADLLDGGPGNDTLSGGDGADTLSGGVGDDTFDGQGGCDAFDGGSGTDFVTDNAAALSVVNVEADLSAGYGTCTL
ncbi:MAG: hypothetical protein RL199_2159 [Pseudomonadota bacterium]